jgi:hypothetical protein
MYMVAELQKRLDDNQKTPSRDEFLKRLEKFDLVKPRETVWSEQRFLDTVRSYVQDGNAS